MSYDCMPGYAGMAQLADPHSGTMILGRVVGVEDAEGLFRVEVSFPLHGDDDGNRSTAFAPVAVPFAGKDYGAFMLPNVDDVVVIGFLSDDPRMPVVLGSVWNGEAKTKETLAADKVERWAMVGHKGTRFAIVEENDTPKIEMSTQQGISITISDEGGGTIEITTGGSTISLSPSEISMTSGTIALDASEFRVTSGSVTVSAPVATFSGCVSSQVSQSTTVVSSTYTPGAGNML